MSATGRGTTRRESDFYPTPQSSIVSLSKFVRPVRVKMLKWGEPCVGNHQLKDIWSSCNNITTPWSWCEIREGKDYLEYGLPEAEAIITNPPYSLAQEFINQTLKDGAKFAAYLLRLNFLGSKKRKNWWQDKMPSHIFVLSERPSFTGKGTDATEYAWFCWDYCNLLTVSPRVYVI